MSNFLQGRQFVFGDVGPIIFLKTVNKEPSLPFVGCHESSCAPTLAATCQTNTFLYNTAAKISIDQTLTHLHNSIAQGGISQFCFAHPAAKVAGFEHSFH